MIEFFAAALLSSNAIDTAEQKLCDPQKYNSQIEPDMQYNESDFTLENFQNAITWFRNADWKSRIEGKTYDEPLNLGWEFEMSYFNRLTAIQGYTLKQRAYGADAKEKEKAVHEFCSFVINSYPLD